ncbi:rRNA maturation RNase YbeY [Pasteuria penetrans]|uniref:rRNA maturation RNase YbeY n=1 Tax=Pasteuria penetrans TaxID=86005 RepID=UPI000FC0F053|nr:rRNA maturation RNase YbeY [Pasteuria penetrans]
MRGTVFSLPIVQQLKTRIESEEWEAWRSIPKAVEVAARRHGIQGLEVVIVGMDDGGIRVLNRDFRRMDCSTDVLSFPQWDPCEIDSLLPPMPLGDIVISIPRARQQAKLYGHSLGREFSFLAVHGFLHLIGFDHQTSEERIVMEREQRTILEIVGLPR